MGITRVADVDANAAGTSGTIRDNAWKTTLYDQIDARWSQQQISLTGAQSDLVITSGGIEADRLLLANASQLTISGITAPASPAKPGKPLTLISTGAGDVILADQSGPTPANYTITKSGVAIYLAAGIGRCELVYDTINSRWHVVSHNQGADLPYTTTWSAASGTAPAIGNGTISSRFYVEGRQFRFEILLTAGSTTTFGNGGQLQFTLPFTAKASSNASILAEYIDTGTAVYHGRAYLNSTTVVGLYTNANPGAIVSNTAPFTFGNADQIRVHGSGWLA